MTTNLGSLLAPLLAVGFALAQDSEQAPARTGPAKAAEDAKPAANPHGYVPYRAHDVRAIVQRVGTKEQPTMTLDGRALHAFVEDLFAHARSYPVAFADDEEKAIARRESSAMSEVLAVAIGDEAAKVDLRVLLDAARLETCAHNLDLKGAATRARHYYERVLKADPEHVEAHLYYGMHLIGLPGSAKDAIPHLEFARDKGQKVAIRGLGLAYVMLQDREKALLHLRAWAKEFEGDVGTARMIDALEHGAEIGVRTVEGDKEKGKDGEGAKSGSGGVKPGTKRDG